MDQTHLHLLITHLPIFGSILGGLVLAYGIWKKSSHANNAAYLLLIISSFGAVVSYLTGEGAEETVEHLPGVSESIIEQHQEFAVFALIALIAVGIAAIVGLLLSRKNSAFTRIVAVATLTLSLVSFALVGWTGYLGGQIRHSEVRAGQSGQTPALEKEE
jgi:uncharacterized membrane protein